MMARQRERNYPPATVPFAATPAGEPPSICDWAEPSVWTDRMLTTLEQGVRGGKWHTLIDKVVCAAEPVCRQQSCDRQSRSSGGGPSDGRGFPGKPPGGTGQTASCPANQYVSSAGGAAGLDRKTGKQGATPAGGSDRAGPRGANRVLHVLEPIFDATFSRVSYGFRHGRGCHHALEKVEALLDAGHAYVVDADLKSYFDTISKPRLMARLREKVSDSRVLRLVEMFLEQGVMDGLQEWTPETGTPQGAVLSPLLANIYLNPLDHALTDAGYAMIRYADDFVILCKTREDAEAALALVQRWVGENELTLHPTKTKIVDARTEGFDFLGYHFRGDLRVPRQKSLKKLKDAVREKTKRTNGHDLPFTCARLSCQLRGWFTYFRHCRESVFRQLDGWIRGRLRSMLRRRQKRRGRGRGKDNQRWPNRFFDEQGLYSLQAAHVRLVQSSWR